MTREEYMRNYIEQMKDKDIELLKVQTKDLTLINLSHNLEITIRLEYYLSKEKERLLLEFTNVIDRFDLYKIEELIETQKNYAVAAFPKSFFLVTDPELVDSLTVKGNNKS